MTTNQIYLESGAKTKAKLLRMTQFCKRRDFIQVASGAAFWLCAAGNLPGSEFWNKKDPSAWTADEILTLATSSPWARTARVLPKPGRDKGGFNRPMPQLAPNQSGNLGDSHKPGDIPMVPVEEVTVIWASGQPILDALKTRFPADFANHYVIGINDLPKLEVGHKVDQDTMIATLQVKGGKSVDAGGMLAGRDTTLFRFSRELFPLTVADKEVLFVLETDQYTIKTPFNLREMIYHGRLAL